MVVHNPNNWHWVDKNCISWAREYFKQRLQGLKTGDRAGKCYAEVSGVSSVEGDCEVSQRKGKAMSLFELKIVMLLKGHVDDSPFEGSISVPEVAFDSAESDYQFEISIYKETVQLREVKPVIRETLLPQLRSLFQKFGQDLLSEHAGDIQVPESQVNSEFTKANLKAAATTSACPATSASASASVSPAPAPTKLSSGGTNRASLHLEPTFNVPALELYRTFLDKSRVMAWSRGSLQASDGSGGGSGELHVGESFELFGGNVTSKLLEAQEPKRLVFQWRLNEWSEKIVSRLEMVFHESREYHETRLQVSWSGVPVGEEDRVKANFEEYYVRSIKLTFGFGAVL